MRKTKKKTQLELIRSVRKEMPPTEKTIRSKKDTPFRKRKHKGKIDTSE